MYAAAAAAAAHDDDDPCDWPHPQHVAAAQLDRALRCPMCGDLYQSPVMLNGCMHSFCSVCIRGMLADCDASMAGTGAPIASSSSSSSSASATSTSTSTAIATAPAGKVSHGQYCPVCMADANECDLRPNRLLEDIVAAFKVARKPLLTLALSSTSTKKNKEEKEEEEEKTKKGNDERAPKYEECEHCMDMQPSWCIAEHRAACARIKRPMLSNGVPDDEPRLPRLALNMLSDKKILAMLHEYNLDTSGNRAKRVSRIRNWVTLYNANLDAAPERRLTASALRSKLRALEQPCLTSSLLQTQAFTLLTKARVKKSTPVTRTGNVESFFAPRKRSQPDKDALTSPSPSTVITIHDNDQDEIENEENLTEKPAVTRIDITTQRSPRLLAHAKKYKSQFDELIQDIRDRQKASQSSSANNQ